MLARIGNGALALHAASTERKHSEGLGYPLARKLDENVAWDLVRKTLALRQVKFLHIDELQHVLQSRNSVEIGKMQDTLKGLLQDKHWPVWLILSGLPSVAAFLADDIQVRRRTRHVVFRPLKFPDEIPMVRRLITFYAKDKGGRECEIAQDNDLIGRLCVSHRLLDQGIGLLHRPPAPLWIPQSLQGKCPGI